MISSEQKKILASAGVEVDFDQWTRQLYATDASIYKITPVGVAYPRRADQARAIVVAAADAGVPVIPRGAGTGLAGGAIGDGLIVDFSRHNREITKLDLEMCTVRVGPGVILDQLNAFLQPHGYRFGPEVATSSRATLGGMIANNSSGSHVPVYGTTADHVGSLEVVFADGRLETTGAGSQAMARRHRFISDLVDRHADEIAERMPPGLLKGWAGYGIDRYLREPDNFNHILSGSEGTLAAIVSAELKIVPLPRDRALGLCFFKSLPEAMEATVELLDLHPAAIEHIDRILFNQTRGQRAFQAARDLLGLDADDCASILIVEFFEDADDRLQALARKRLGQRLMILRDAVEMDMVWSLRKAGLSLLTGRRGGAKPVAGIEDAAVRPECLPEYVAALSSLLESLGLEASFYGHAATGLLHVRPVLDLRHAGDLKKFRQLTNEVSALVRQFKGSLAAEHGVGMARTEYMAEHLGERVLRLMREIKTTLDPGDLFNPGKIVGGERFRIDRDLRLGAGYNLQLPFQPRLAFAARDGSFVGNLEQCNGCGGCRKTTPMMCPTFAATGDEIMSTRGRANTVRGVLEQVGRDSPGRSDLLRSTMLEHALSNCLSCKACATECPSNVDFSLLKAELTHARHQQFGLPMRARLIGSVDLLGKLGCLAPGVANAAMRCRWPRRLLRMTLGITEERPLPRFTHERFDRWFTRDRPAQDGGRGTVILWDDTFTRYHEPEIGIAAVSVLEAAGYKIVLPPRRECCGRPAFSQGDLRRAARLGNHNLATLREMSSPRECGGAGLEEDTPIVFLEPSCHSMFVSDYRELKLPYADRIAARSHLFETFVADLLDRDSEALHFQETTGHVAIHAHCHAKSLMDPICLAHLARRLPGREVTLLESGCCGMAGAFGALESKYALSLKVAEPLVELVRKLREDTVVVASGTSCRQQIEHLTPVRPRHMAVLLAEALEDQLHCSR